MIQQFSRTAPATAHRDRTPVELERLRALVEAHRAHERRPGLSSARVILAPLVAGLFAWGLLFALWAGMRAGEIGLGAEVQAVALVALVPVVAWIVRQAREDR